MALSCSYQQQIEELLASNPDFVQPEARRNEVMGWVSSGLQDFSLSRAKNEWGIKVPWDTTQTFYVWTDALMGYMTGRHSDVKYHEHLLILRLFWLLELHECLDASSRQNACY